jgi:hypothetical protein
LLSVPGADGSVVDDFVVQRSSHRITGLIS